MDIQMRTVIFQGKVEIMNVPVFSCGHCQLSEVFPPVKSELIAYIRSLGAESGPIKVQFDEHSELAFLLQQVTHKENSGKSAEAIVEERINELLDLLLLAQSLDDAMWQENIRLRLTQITSHISATYRLA
jgi:hypothetical protein